MVQRYSGLRLVDVVTLRTDSLRDDGLMIMSQEKNERPVFVPLPGFVLDLLRNLPPKSTKYFFSTGTSTIKTAVNDWSEKMRQRYVKAGVEIFAIAAMCRFLASAMTEATRNTWSRR